MKLFPRKKCPDCELPMFDLHARLGAGYKNLYTCPQCKVLFRSQEYRDKTGKYRVALRREDKRDPRRRKS